MEELSRRERRKAFKEQNQEEVKVKERNGGLVKWLVILLLIGSVGFVVWWLWREASRPLPGQQFADLGRDHVTDISNTSYSSDPPTSGPHFPVWAKKGVYDRVISDGHLIHSLEHGYVVISYNCEKSVSLIPQVSTQEATANPSAKPLTRMVVGLTGAMSFFGPTNAPLVEIELSESFRTDECKKLVSDLSGFVNDNPRVILVPRPGMDSRIALTAWTRLDTMDNVDPARIKNLIDSYQNKGPEKTTE